MNEHQPARTVSLFRNGRNQAVRIPVEFELPGTEAVMWREGDRLVLRPKHRPTLAEVLDKMEPLTIEELPDVTDDDLLPLDDADLTS